MPIDHSKTYSSLSFRNIGHMWRARAIYSAVRKLGAGASTYCEVGCSNGFLTERLAAANNFTLTIGLDNEEQNLAIARSQYPHIHFQLVDLNIPYSGDVSADFVTCLETMEHVGNIDVALDNVRRIGKPGATFLFTVPIEVGWLGIAKYFIKTRLYGDSLAELSPNPAVWTEYERTLLRREGISRFRNVRHGWGTHFGFDYREFERLVQYRFAYVKTWTVATSRFLSATGS